MRHLRNYTIEGTTHEFALAVSERELRSILSLKTDKAYAEAVERLAAAGVLVQAADRPERWVARAPGDPRGKGRDRLLLFVSVFDPLRIAQLHRAAIWDERGKGDPRAPQGGRVIVLD